MSKAAARATALYRGVNFRRHPERYRVGRGEQGVLIAEPYKSELLPLWRFRTPAVARASAAALWRAFIAYRDARDFVGMDMARKYLQMGFTRARRYANRRSGRKYGSDGALTPVTPDLLKARSAAIFYKVWRRAEADAVYRGWRASQRRAAAAAKHGVRRGSRKDGAGGRSTRSRRGGVRGTRPGRSPPSA